MPFDTEADDSSKTGRILRRDISPRFSENTVQDDVFGPMFEIPCTRRIREAALSNMPPPTSYRITDPVVNGQNHEAAARLMTLVSDFIGSAFLGEDHKGRAGRVGLKEAQPHMVDLVLHEGFRILVQDYPTWSDRPAYSSTGIYSEFPLADITEQDADMLYLAAEKGRSVSAEQNKRVIDFLRAKAHAEAGVVPRIDVVEDGHMMSVMSSFKIKDTYVTAQNIDLMGGGLNAINVGARKVAFVGYGMKPNVLQRRMDLFGDIVPRKERDAMFKTFSVVQFEFDSAEDIGRILTKSLK